MLHELKIDQEYFTPVVEGTKKFEIRYNDRNFCIGDTVVLQEIEPVSRNYTGREVEVTIIYITNYEQKKGFIVFGFEKK